VGNLLLWRQLGEVQSTPAVKAGAAEQPQHAVSLVFTVRPQLRHSSGVPNQAMQAVGLSCLPSCQARARISKLKIRLNTCLGRLGYGMSGLNEAIREPGLCAAKKRCSTSS
jgi:hypothetical protein